MDISIDLKNYAPDAPIVHRQAARALISNQDKYLMIFSKYGDYKFPGGGIKPGEDPEDALCREVSEETGFAVKKETIQLIGRTHERRKGHNTDVMVMESLYYGCEVNKIPGERNLDDYEEEYGYEVVWMNLESAIEKNKAVTDLEACPWVIRDTQVMQWLVSNA